MLTSSALVIPPLCRRASVRKSAEGTRHDAEQVDVEVVESVLRSRVAGVATTIGEPVDAVGNDKLQGPAAAEMARSAQEI